MNKEVGHQNQNELHFVFDIWFYRNKSAAPEQGVIRKKGEEEKRKSVS